MDCQKSSHQEIQSDVYRLETTKSYILGTQAASRELVLIPHSDQVMLQDTVERSISLFRDYDMLCL
jgi:hypothetical protein